MDKQELSKVEAKVNEIGRALSTLAQGGALHAAREGQAPELLQIIRRPGWTTPAELLFFHGLLDSMLTQAKALETLHSALINGSRAVQGE